MAGTFWFFRFVILSKFDEIPGNIGDARFLIYTCEHWHKVFQGTAAWLSPPIFYPIQGVLGYSDALFIYAVPFSFFRYLQLDIYTSFQAIVLTLPILAYAGTVWLLRSALGLGRCAAIVGAMLFAFSSPMATSMAHAQLQSVAFVPYLVLLLSYYVRNIHTLKGRLSGLGFAVLFPLLAYTSFYIAWYFAIFSLLIGFLAIFGVIVTGQNEKLFSWLRYLSDNRLSLVINLFVCIVCGIPFLVTYIPILRLFSGRSFQETWLMLPMPIDLVNVGFDNAVWGPALQALAPGLQSRPLFWELDKGLPPLTLIFFLFSALLAWFQYRRSRFSGFRPRSAGTLAHSDDCYLVYYCGLRRLAGHAEVGPNFRVVVGLPVDAGGNGHSCGLPL